MATVDFWNRLEKVRQRTPGIGNLRKDMVIKRGNHVRSRELPSVKHYGYITHMKPKKC